MLKFFLLTLFAFILLVGCTPSTNDQEVWDNIFDKEYANLDTWAGSGLYFYEKGNSKYCAFMIYGSGVPVAGLHISSVEIDEEGIIVIELPVVYSTGYIDIENQDNFDLVKVEILFTKEGLLLGNRLFEETIHPQHIFILNDL
ncbi:MAG: hypothetical protein ABII85_03785 [Bacillota bacterium]